MKIVREHISEAIMPVKAQLYTIYIGKTHNGIPSESDEDLLKYYGLYATRYPNGTYNIIGSKKNIESFTEVYNEYKVEELEPTNINQIEILKDYIKTLENDYLLDTKHSKYINEAILPVKTIYYKIELPKIVGRSQEEDLIFIHILKDFHISNIIVGTSLNKVQAIFIGTKPDLIKMYCLVWRATDNLKQKHTKFIESKIKPAKESDLKRHDIEEYYKAKYESK